MLGRLGWNGEGQGWTPWSTSDLRIRYEVTVSTVSSNRLYEDDISPNLASTTLEMFGERSISTLLPDMHSHVSGTLERHLLPDLVP